jgi:hypothetical protein
MFLAIDLGVTGSLALFEDDKVTLYPMPVNEIISSR